MIMSSHFVTIFLDILGGLKSCSSGICGGFFFFPLELSIHYGVIEVTKED